MAAKKQMEKEYDKWQGSEFKKGMIISSWSAWQAATAIAEEKLKSDNKPMPKLPLYTEIMKEIYGDDWAVDAGVCSASMDRVAHSMYNYISRQLSAHLSKR